MRRILLVLIVGVVSSGIALCWMNAGSVRSHQADTRFLEENGFQERFQQKGSDGGQTAAHQPQPKESLAAAFVPLSSSKRDKAFYDPLVIAPCNLIPVSEQDVSSQVDGVFEAIDVDLGQHVAKGTVLGRLDDRQLRAQVESLEIRAASTAAERIAKAHFDEAESKVQYALKANESGLITVPDLEYKTYLFQRERFAQEIAKAKEEREGAQKELEKAKVVLKLHEIRSALSGEIVKIYKRNGEAVKQAEPLFKIANSDYLRVEGLCKVQQASLIRVGMRALVEPELRGEQMMELVGHTGTVTSLAVSSDGRLVASASEDRSVLLWSWPGGVRLGSLPHPAEVTAVAMGPGNTILTGSADGQVRLWRLEANGKNQTPLVFAQAHEGAIRAVAFSRDGITCATGGEDKRIGIWDVATGTHRLWLQPEEGLSAHQGTVTSLHFAPDQRLISAGRDNVLRVWQLGQEGKLVNVHTGRTGEVTSLGISPDGRRVLLDMGEELRILDRDGGGCLGSLRNLKQGRFQSFAQFAPSGKLLLTAASNGRLQLWRAPATPRESQFFRQGYAHGFHRSSLLALSALGSQTNYAGWVSSMTAAGSAAAPKLWQLSGREIRHFVAPSGGSSHCAAFATDESVFFTAGTDKVVRVWAIPPAQHWEQPLEGRITYIGSQVERGTDMVRIRAELENPRPNERRLRAGLFAVMRLFPETAGLP